MHDVNELPSWAEATQAEAERQAASDEPPLSLIVAARPSQQAGAEMIKILDGIQALEVAKSARNPKSVSFECALLSGQGERVKAARLDLWVPKPTRRAI
ncbi:hypothetical protein LRP30_32820 [Bradyrhizobium sp. C-145]|uniref:hypothetical protein n=1 Tax=Bradyrhizobium sp. C-145 TaxID=574727 RepID=UPI00201B6AF3|nr:hypothetical protein [Bradyrhizobium sp. C-145]UQR61573.1 hypothetical protein LRP30_32820 [Bradyrhizobium sp. C-145]